MSKPRIDPPVEYSRGEYYGKTTASFAMFVPVQYSGGIAARIQGSLNKFEVIPYADNSGVEPCPGVTVESKEAGAAADEISVGLNYAREMALLRHGWIYMVYQAGTTTPYPGMRIAPYPGGFQEWKPGMFLLGKMMSETGVAVNFADDASERVFRVEIDIDKGDGTYETESIAVDSSGGSGNHFALLSNASQTILNIVDSGAASIAAFTLTPGDPGTNATEYSVDATGKIALNDAVVGPVIVSYKW